MNGDVKKFLTAIIGGICIVFGVVFLFMCYMKSGMIAPGSRHPEPVPVIPLILGIILIAVGIITPLLYKLIETERGT
ncbi:MAG: hypothetical protein U9O49_02245 [Candidatus Thermoplasmatota archaeon]|nr:hypothetical protein [Candidatus Thermoplasmatota archaeon]